MFDELGAPMVNNHLTKFSNAVKSKLEELNHAEGDETGRLYKDICTAIHYAVDTDTALVHCRGRVHSPRASGHKKWAEADDTARSTSSGQNGAPTSC